MQPIDSNQPEPSMAIQFINDSKATNVDSVFYALSSMDAPTIWIAGGQDKGNDYSQLDELGEPESKSADLFRRRQP